LTLEEKIPMMIHGQAGAPRLGLKPFQFWTGGQGLATCSWGCTVALVSAALRVVLCACLCFCLPGCPFLTWVQSTTLLCPPLFPPPPPPPPAPPQSACMVTRSAMRAWPCPPSSHSPSCWQQHSTHSWPTRCV
jgi:hypothetical protein